MNVIGVRCSNTDYAFAVLSGSKKSPQLIQTGHILYPKGFTKPHSLRWLYLEIEVLIKTYTIKKIGMKASQSMSANKAFEDRVEHEAMIYLVAANQNIRDITKKRNNTLAKQLGFKGRAHYLAQFDTSAIPEFDNFDDKIREAILVAWSELQ